MIGIWSRTVAGYAFDASVDVMRSVPRDDGDWPWTKRVAAEEGHR